jgi:nitrate reductase NapE
MDELPEQDPESRDRSREIRVFVFLTVVMAPMIAVAVVASYGLMIWIYQMLAGPPTG